MSGRVNAGVRLQPWGVATAANPIQPGAQGIQIRPVGLPLPRTPGSWTVTGITVEITLGPGATSYVSNGDIQCIRLDQYIRVGPSRILLFTTNFNDLANSDNPVLTFIYSGGFPVQWSDTWELEAVARCDPGGPTSVGLAGFCNINLIGDMV